MQDQIARDPVLQASVHMTLDEVQAVCKTVVHTPMDVLGGMTLMQVLLPASYHVSWTMLRLAGRYRVTM